MRYSLLPKKNRSLIKGPADYILETFCSIIIGLFALCCFGPFIYVFCVSFMSYEEYLAAPLRIIPRAPTINAYREIWGYNLIHTGFRVSIFITVFGTILSVFLLVISAYPLSKSSLKGRNVVMGMILFTMFFNGGMIPNYLLVRNLGIYDTIWALIFPGCINAFYLILMKNFIQTSIPVSLEEAARVDGANEIRILYSVIVPLLKPAIATMIIFNAVNYWNNYFLSMMYISSRKLWPLILVLRELVVENTDSASPVTLMLIAQEKSHPFTLRMAAIIIVITPILLVYPFMQKYFIKGINLGAVKE